MTKDEFMEKAKKLYRGINFRGVMSMGMESLDCPLIENMKTKGDWAIFQDDRIVAYIKNRELIKLD